MSNFPNDNERQIPTKTSAFFKGGCGCLLAFVAFGTFVWLFNELFGGRVNWHADLSGIVVIFLIGGVFGLYTQWIYQKGFNAGRKP